MLRFDFVSKQHIHNFLSVSGWRETVERFTLDVKDKQKRLLMLDGKDLELVEATQIEQLEGLLRMIDLVHAPFSVDPKNITGMSIAQCEFELNFPVYLHDKALLGCFRESGWSVTARDALAGRIPSISVCKL